MDEMLAQTTNIANCFWPEGVMFVSKRTSRQTISWRSDITSGRRWRILLDMLSDGSCIYQRSADFCQIEISRDGEINEWSFSNSQLRCVLINIIGYQCPLWIYLKLSPVWVALIDNVADVCIHLINIVCTVSVNNWRHVQCIPYVVHNVLLYVVL